MLPKIRQVQPIPFQDGGEPAFLLRDPLQLDSRMLVIPQTVAPLLHLCDGTRDADTLRLIMEHHFKVRIRPEDLGRVLEALDGVYLIENARSQAAYEAALDAYRSAAHREPSSTGGSYPADPDALRLLLDGYLEEAGSPGTVPRTASGLLSPHIDYERGASTYAEVWSRAAGALESADLIVAIGTDHYGGTNEITLTRQNYASPLGVSPTDQGVVEAIAGAIGEEAAFRGELYHKHEHSLELPLVWLQHVAGDREILVVPVLCGGLAPGSPAVSAFIGALREAATDRNVFTLISGDLAHAGPAFGGDEVGPEKVKAVEDADLALCKHLAAGDPDTFLAEILAVEDANNVCGTYPLYLGMHSFGLGRGELAGYRQCPADEEGTSIVSVAGMLFHSDEWGSGRLP